MYIAEALVPIWIESGDGTSQAQTSNRPVLIVVETLGATLRGQLLNLTESKARVLPNDPFLMCSNVRVTLRFRWNDIVYTLSGLTEASGLGDSFHLVFDAVTRQKIIIFVGAPKVDSPDSTTPEPPRKRSKDEQRIVRREPPPGGIERRVHARHELEASANLMVLERGRVFKCLILEISLSGCRLFNEIPISLDHDTQVEVEFTGHGYPFRLAAKVRTKSDEHLIGLEFMNASPRTLDRLKDLVTELEMKAARSFFQGSGIEGRRNS
jgi:hypothetical protein